MEGWNAGLLVKNKLNSFSNIPVFHYSMSEEKAKKI
jgi:hypothetical protein